MKTPIEPSEIRFRDLIRWESPTSDTAREFRHTDPNCRHTSPGTYFLLDRPKPPVSLPSEPTLGWLTYLDEGISITEVATWMRQKDGVFGGAGRVPAALVTGFVRATAVPTETFQALLRVSKEGFPIGAGGPTGDVLGQIYRLEEYVKAIEARA